MKFHRYGLELENPGGPLAVATGHSLRTWSGSDNGEKADYALACAVSIDKGDMVGFACKGDEKFLVVGGREQIASALWLRSDDNSTAILAGIITAEYEDLDDELIALASRPSQLHHLKATWRVRGGLVLFHPACSAADLTLIRDSKSGAYAPQMESAICLPMTDGFYSISWWLGNSEAVEFLAVVLAKQASSTAR